MYFFTSLLHYLIYFVKKAYPMGNVPSRAILITLLCGPVGLAQIILERDNSMHSTYNLPHLLRKLRKKHGLSLKQVGKIVGKDPSQVWRWENGKSEIPMTSFIRLANSYGLCINNEELTT